MSQALYRKWRPHRWEQIIGQQHIVQTLRSAVAANRVAHAYLFAGPRGTGKTTTARLLAKAINCQDADLQNRPCDQCEFCTSVNQGRFLDLIEIDAASNTSVEDVRDLREKINFRPNQAPFKVYIIDEVHMLSTAAFNALLKTLEEPPPHAIFILATTEIHKIPATVLSRCQRHEFRRVPVQDIVVHLGEIVAAEMLKVDREALTLVARQATGSVRDAISLLDQLGSTGHAVTLEVAQTVLGTAANQAVLGVVDAALAGDAGAGLDQLHHALDAGSDPRQLARQIVDYLRSLLLIQMGNNEQVEATPDMRAQMARHAGMCSVPQILAMIRSFNQAANDARSAWQPSLPLEIALAEAIDAGKPVGTPDGKPGGTPGGKPEGEALTLPEAGDAPTVRGARGKKPASEGAAPQAEAPSPQSSESEETAEGDLTIKVINEHWRQILAKVKAIGPNAEALLRSGRLLGIKDGVLYFGFSSDVLKSKMEKSENIDLVEKVLSQVLNARVPVRCVVASGKSSALPPDVDSDGMVASALRDLGGEIVDIQ